jgi:exopolysaccharide production protein ExoQ
MSPSLASLVYTLGIAGLFYLDRDKTIKTSKALWLPVLYLGIIGSRPLSVWLGISAPNGTDVTMEGSPIDGAFFQILLVAAVCVLIRRGSQVTKFMTVSFPIPVLIYFVFCLLSVIWSDYSLVVLKKWIKSVEDLVMILVLVTDTQPVAALRRLFSRLGFILLPYSLLLIKYYPGNGRFYGFWDGAETNVGVTQDKNFLGVISFVLSLGALWRVLALWSGEESSPDRRRHLWAQGILLAMGIWLLSVANSATSLVCFVLGAGLMLITKRSFFRRHPAGVHVLVLSLIVIAAVVMLMGGGASVTHALGRNPTLTGRTEIWAAVIPMAPNPLVGAGFESFWLNPQVHARLWTMFPNLPLNEAHDGYLEVYLNLGWIGVCLIALVLLDAYRRANQAFRRMPALGGLLLAYALTGVTYNMTEAGFRMLNPFWILFLLAVIEASGVATGAIAAASPPIDTPDDQARELPKRNALAVKLSNRPTAGKMVRRQES